MESLIGHMSPLQMIFLFATQLWVYVIFPMMVFKKLNYLTELVESQFEEESSENQQS